MHQRHNPFADGESRLTLVAAALYSAYRGLRLGAAQQELADAPGSDRALQSWVAAAQAALPVADASRWYPSHWPTQAMLDAASGHILEGDVRAQVLRILDAAPKLAPDEHWPPSSWPTAAMVPDHVLDHEAARAAVSAVLAAAPDPRVELFATDDDGTVQMLMAYVDALISADSSQADRARFRLEQVLRSSLAEARSDRARAYNAGIADERDRMAGRAA